MEGKGTKLLKNSVVLLIGTVLTKGINFVMAPLFTRWMSMEDYGTFDVFSTYSVLLIPIIALGVHHAIFRFILEDTQKENVTCVFSNAIVINGIGLIIYFLGAIVIVLVNPSLIYGVFWLTILFISQTLQNMMCMFLRGLKYLKYYTYCNVICTLSIFFLCVVFVCFLDYGLEGMVIGYSFSYLLSALCGMLFSKSRNIFNVRALSVIKMKELLTYSIPMIPNSIAWWILNISNRIIVSTILGVTTNAILAVANKLPNICVSIYDVFQTAWLESASEGIKDKDWNVFFKKTFNTMGKLCISISMLIITSNFIVYDLLFTKDYVVGKSLVPILAVSIIFSTLSQCLGSVFIAEFDSKIQAKTMIEAGMINIIVHIVLINFIGIYASAISTLVSYIYLFIVRYYKIKIKYGINVENEVKFLFSMCIIFWFVSYINNWYLDLVVLGGSILLAFYSNKKLLSIICMKFRKK